MSFTLAKGLSESSLTMAGTLPTLLSLVARPVDLNLTSPVCTEVVLVVFIMILLAMYGFAFACMMSRPAEPAKVLKQTTWSITYLMLFTTSIYIQHIEDTVGELASDKGGKTLSLLFCLICSPEHADLPRSVCPIIYKLPTSCYMAATGNVKNSTSGQVRFQPAKIVKPGRQTTRAKLPPRGTNDDHARVTVSQSHKSAEQEVRFGCPFSKHSPERYAGVNFKACTNPPGLEPKHVSEHCRRVHFYLQEKNCRYCGSPWTKVGDERRLEFEEHSSSCLPTLDKINSQPEIMTAAQERDLAATATGLSSCTAEMRWIATYSRLFPGHYPIPSPYYDYYIARHTLVDPRTHSGLRASDPLFGVFPQSDSTVQSIPVSETQATSMSTQPPGTNTADSSFESIQSQWNSGQMVTGPPTNQRPFRDPQTPRQNNAPAIPSQSSHSQDRLPFESTFASPLQAMHTQDHQQLTGLTMSSDSVSQLFGDSILSNGSGTSLTQPFGQRASATGSRQPDWNHDMVEQSMDTLWQQPEFGMNDVDWPGYAFDGESGETER